LAEVVALRERALERAPGDNEKTRKLAWSYSVASSAQVGLRHLGEGAALQRRALALRERLTQIEPANAEWQRERMDSQIQLAKIESDMGHPEEAVAYGRAAAAHAEEAYRAQKGEGTTPQDLVAAELGCIQAERAAGHVRAAREAAARGAAVLEDAVRSQGTAQRYNGLFDMYVARAQASVTLGELAPAREDAARALALLPKLAGEAEFAQNPLIAQTLQGEVALAGGDADEAARQLDSALTTFAALPADTHDADSQVDLALLAFRLARRTTGSNDYDARGRSLVADLAARGELSVPEQQELRKAGYR
jgi:hypothetical protein